MRCEALILAAGLGTRMKSAIPKVLHPLAGRPMIAWSVEACEFAVARVPFVVLGPELTDLPPELGLEINVIIQEDRLGTGHAVMQAEKALRSSADCILVTYADLPLLRGETLKKLVDRQLDTSAPFTMLTAQSTQSRGFGRIERDGDGRIRAIIEEAHATRAQKSLTELNAGAYCFDAGWLWENLPGVPASPKGEYYLTDLVGVASAKGLTIESVSIQSEDEMIGVNDRIHLAEAEGAMRMRILQQWMLEGVTVSDPASTYVGPDVQLGQDTVVFPNTHLEGRTVIGGACEIGPNTVIRDSTIGGDCRVFASVVEGATLEDQVRIGPFAHLRKGAYLEQGVHMGNFGEVKNSRLGKGAKMGHFSYIGDATVGSEVNIGAGVITCNYDGEEKHRTEIGENAFIGSDTMLVAPVRIGKGARTGAGSVVTKDVPDGSVAVGVPARVIQVRDRD
jgi:bifunctional UDP-N-acetylglucosamine pyrophosphorylase/glucosamine-1-phosphate N-acetyltransferase